MSYDDSSKTLSDPLAYRQKDTNLDAETKELIEAALHYEEIARWNSGRSEFVSENGRHGRSPWSEFVRAVTAYRDSRILQAPDVHDPRDVAIIGGDPSL